MAIDLLEQILPHTRNAIYPLRKVIIDWKMKEGDIPGAGSISFKDKSWTSIRVPFHWGKYDKIYWFRQTITIEPEFAGKPLVLLLDFPEALIFLNGKPYQGIDQFHKEVLITSKAKLNEQFVIAIQAYSGKKHEHSVFTSAELAVLDTTARRLTSGLSVLHEVDKLMEHGSQESREIRELIRRTLIFLKYFSPTGEEYPNAIRRAYNFLLNTLETEFRTSLPGLRHLVGYSHINTCWLWSLKETTRKFARSLLSAFQLMEEFPEYKFSLNQPILFDLIKTEYPDLFKQVKQKVLEGKFEPFGSMWVESECNLPSGESIVRQILMGKRFFKQEFGSDSNILWLPNLSGFNSALPQVMAKSGIKFFYASKVSSNDPIKLPNTSFWWQGIDGSRVLAHISPFGLDSQIGPKSMLKSGSNSHQQNPELPSIQTYGYSYDGIGPAKENLEYAAILKTIVGLPSSQISTVQNFFQHLQEKSENLPVINDTLHFENNRGTYTNHGWIKKENRECEILLYNSELFSSISTIYGKNASSRHYPKKEYEQAWKKLLLNQSLNIISGTCSADVYKNVQQDYQDIRKICSSEIDKCIQGMARPVKKTKNLYYFTLFNSLGWQRNSYVEIFIKTSEKHIQVNDSEGKQIPHQVIERKKNGQSILCFVEGVPPFSFKDLIVSVNPKPEDKPVQWKGSTSGIETPYYRIRLDRKGELSSIYAKFLHREILQKGKRGNYFATFRDSSKVFDLWNMDPDFEKHKTEIWKIKQLKILEQGPLRATFRIEFRTINKSILNQDIHFYHKSPLIEFRTNVNWQEKQNLMKVVFPLNMKTSNLTYEIPFGVLSRSFKSRKDNESLKGELPVHQWADISDPKYGVSLINDCKYGYDVTDHTLRLTLLRSPHYPDPSDPGRPAEEFTDQGNQSFNYSLLPHSGSWIKSNTIQHAHELNNPIFVFPNFQSYSSPPFISLSKSNILIDSIKKAEENPLDKQAGNSLILRMHESCGISTDVMLRFGFNAAGAAECDLLENELKQYKIGKSKLGLKFKPFEIKTIKLAVKPDKKKK